MKKDVKKYSNKKALNSIKQSYGVSLPYTTDKELYAHIKKQGLPSLVKLLKMVHGN